jgi:formate/nitrite transporter FocA (FNT family)
MFLVPLGIMCGADVTYSEFLINNLVPVTIGNAIGATAFVSFLPWFTDWYGPTLNSPPKAKEKMKDK